MGVPDVNAVERRLSNGSTAVSEQAREGWLCLTDGCCARHSGYADQKQQIEDTMLLALLHPDVYDTIAKGTRRHYSSNKPRAVLFEGPPGTGKTTSARSACLYTSVHSVHLHHTILTSCDGILQLVLVPASSSASPIDSLARSSKLLNQCSGCPSCLEAGLCLELHKRCLYISSYMPTVRESLL